MLTPRPMNNMNTILILISKLDAYSKANEQHEHHPNININTTCFTPRPMSNMNTILILISILHATPRPTNGQHEYPLILIKLGLQSLSPSNHVNKLQSSQSIAMFYHHVFLYFSSAISKNHLKD